MSNSRNARRVVVTGLGALSPLGLTMADSWASALRGRSGIGRITHFDTKDCPVTIAGEVQGFDITRAVGPFYPHGATSDPSKIVSQAANAKEARKMGRFCQIAVSAALEAYADSGLDAYRSKISPERIAVNVGVGMGGLPEIESVHQDLLNKGYRRITPFLIPMIITNMASGQISILLNLQGANLCNVTACASSAHSLGESLRLIQRGDADVVFAGGAESVVSPLGIGAFASMRALSTRNEEPEKASRPFDIGRDGFVMGEGACILILEEREHAIKRGAKIYAEFVGYGLSGDAYHMTTPAPEGQGGYRAMKMALEDAGLRPDQVGYVNAHGTSTPAGDAEEARAISRLFGESKPQVSSTKSMTGHLLGAAGAIEAAFSILAIRDSKIPPTINLDNLDPECAKTGLDFTPHHAVERKLEGALSNSFGFGGTNASLIFKKA